MAPIVAAAFAAVLLALGGGALAERGWSKEARRMVGLGYAFITLAGLAALTMIGMMGYRIAQWV